MIRIEYRSLTPKYNNGIYVVTKIGNSTYELAPGGRIIVAPPKLYPCQECGMTGLVRGSRGSYECGWCSGTGKVDGSTRAQWLNYKKNLKKRAIRNINGTQYDWVWFE
jgi:ribosomal protein L37AE/L43A